MKRTLDSDDLDILSAIWILASNDENPIVTYRGLAYRLDLPAEFDVRTCIRKHPELFRQGVTIDRLNAWKEQLRSGRSNPSWLRTVTDRDARLAEIEKLSPDDVFRSQFRAQAAEKSPIEIIKWGLEHLDRLRKAKAEARDASAKRWQMWLVFWVSLVGVLSQFAIAFAKYKGWI